MLVPAIYQGRFLPVRKKSVVLFPALFDKYKLIPMLKTKKEAMMIQSNVEMYIYSFLIV